MECDEMLAPVIVLMGALLLMNGLGISRLISEIRELRKEVSRTGLGD